MPSLTLSDLAAMRVETISFFLVVLLAATWGLQLLWNGLRSDFPKLPRLSYKRALTLVALWGLMFVLVLSMISGARELMTPNAWQREGLTYQPADREARERAESQRWLEMAELKLALWTYAEANDGRLPPSSGVPDISPEAWTTGDVTGVGFIYRPGAQVGSDEVRVVAHEPTWFDPPLLALFSDGSVRRLDKRQLDAATGGTP
jgi:hypothetical protein